MLRERIQARSRGDSMYVIGIKRVRALIRSLASVSPRRSIFIKAKVNGTLFFVSILFLSLPRASSFSIIHYLFTHSHKRVRARTHTHTRTHTRIHTHTRLHNTYTLSINFLSLSLSFPPPFRRLLHSQTRFRSFLSLSLSLSPSFSC